MKVLCFGDSNTYGYDPRSYVGGRYGADARWVDVLAEKSGWEVVNAGENGRMIPRGESAQQDFARLLRGVDLTLIMLGSNDLLQGADAAETAERMEAFLAPFARQNVVLMSPPPMQMGTWVTQARLLTDSRQLIAAYGALAQKLGLQWINTGDWEIDLTFDGVHFSQEGHRTFGEQLYRALKDKRISI